jgi:uncharacterized protein YndB with AHSA1/START domain
MLDRVPVARAEMLIRRPVSEVFEALVNPDIAVHFWLNRASARLEEAVRITWEWGAFGAPVDVTVLEFEKDRRVLFEWTAFGKPTIVEWTFTSFDGATYVTTMNRGFAGDLPQRTKAAIDSTESFTHVLAGLKAWLEHGIQLNLITDRHPDPHAFAARRA